jgi:hypothetical protein
VACRPEGELAKHTSGRVRDHVVIPAAVVVLDTRGRYGRRQPPEPDRTRHVPQPGAGSLSPVSDLAVKIGARSGSVRARISSPACKVVEPRTGTSWSSRMTKRPLLIHGGDQGAVTQLSG